jgi:hypothetical protein
VHRALWFKDSAKRAQTKVRIMQMVKHPGANNKVEGAPELGHVLDRHLMQFKVSKIVSPLKLTRMSYARFADVDGRDMGIRLAKCVSRRLGRAAAGNQDFLVSA